MGITYQIPHTARFIPTTNIFTGLFNNPTIGKYDFGTALNTGQSVLPLKRGTTYLIDRISTGGNIDEGTYLDAIETLPEIILRRSKSNEIVYKTTVPLVNYVDDQDMIAWVKSEKGGEILIVDFTGVLDQTAALVGVLDVKIHLSYSIYAIDSTVFERKFRDVIGDDVGNQVTGRS